MEPTTPQPNRNNSQSDQPTTPEGQSVQPSTPTPTPAPQNTSPKPHSKKPLIIMTSIVVGILVVTGIYFFVSNAGQKSTETAASTQPATPASPNTSPSPTENPSTSVENISLKTVNGHKGTATATRSFSSGTFTHSAIATTADPAQGKFYEGWLVTKTSPVKFISTGKLTKASGTYSLNFTSTTNYSDYSQVVITEETSANGLDNKPETHVFEGDF